MPNLDQGWPDWTKGLDPQRAFTGTGSNPLHGFGLGMRGGFRDSEPAMGGPVTGRPGQEVDAAIIFHRYPRPHPLIVLVQAGLVSFLR